MSTKSREALLTIGELSRLTGVRVSTLRQWGDKHGLLHPCRSKGRFRLYTKEDVNRSLALKQALLVDRIPLALMQQTHARFSESQASHQPYHGADRDRTTSTTQESFKRLLFEPLSAVDPESNTPRQQSPLGALYQATTVLSQAKDIPQLAEQALTLLSSTFNAEAAAIILTQDDPAAEKPALTKFSRGLISRHITQSDKALVNRLREQGTVLTFSNSEDWPGCILGATCARSSVLAAPLYCAGEFRGLIFTASILARQYSAEEMLLASALASILASTLENATLRQRARDIEQRIKTLIDNDRATLLITDARGIIAYANDSTLQVLGYDPSELQGKPLTQFLAHNTRNTNLIAPSRLKQMRDECFELDMLASDGHSVRLEVSGLSGCFSRSSGSKEISGFVVRDNSERKRIELELERRTSELSVLNTLAAALSKSLDLDEILQLAVTTVAKTTGHGPVLIALLDDHSGRLILKNHCNAPDELVEDLKHIKLGEGLTGRVALTGEPLYVANVGEDSRSTSVVPYAKKHKHRSFVCVPLKSTSGIFGTMTVTSQRFKLISQEEAKLILSIGHMIGSAIERARMHEQSVKTYFDRMVLMRNELRLIAFSRAQERFRIATELRALVLDPIQEASEVYPSEDKAQSAEEGQVTNTLAKCPPAALAALNSLEKELLGAGADMGLPSLLQHAVNWRNRYDSSGRQLVVNVESWPDDVPEELVSEIYVMVIKILYKTRAVAPSQNLAITLFHDDECIGLRITPTSGSSKQETQSKQANLVWRNLDLSDIEGMTKSLDGKARLGQEQGQETLTLTVARNWGQAPDIKPMTVLIVNDQPLYGQALSGMLDTQESIQILGVVQNTQEALHLTKILTPDVILIDVTPPAMKGIDTTRAIRTAFPNAKILILIPDQGSSVVEGLLAGATGFANKTCSPVELLRSIKSMLENDPAITPAVAGRALDLLAPSDGSWDRGSSAHRLTPREVEILHLVAMGKSSKEISQVLRVKDKTVRRHISNMYQKLQIYDRAQLVLYAARKGLISIHEGNQRNGFQSIPEPAVNGSTQQPMVQPFQHY